ncbi:GHKL domain-containing protein [Paenibacillus thiaminolyticus]|uniref:sensor histidine kinase n=1 Tax=Paenibacillus TaxID=44249 RepID=UPI00387E1323
MNAIKLFGLFAGITLLQLFLLNRYFFVLFRESPERKSMILTSYLLAGVIIYVPFIAFFPAVVNVFMSIGSAFLIALNYQARLESKLFFAIQYLILELISEALSYFLIYQFRFMPGVDDLSTLETKLLVSMLSTLIMFLFILLIKFIKRSRDYKISILYYLILTLVILISLFILNTLFFYSENNTCYVLSIIGILCINIIVIYLFDRLIEKFRLQDEYRQLKKQMEHQNISYEKTANSFKSIKRIIHDTNKQLLYIRTCIQENELQEAIQHINRTLNQIDTSYLRITTGNLVIDALVNNVLNMAYENNITVHYNINFNADQVDIDRYDLCIVVGNVLDNAIEAVRLIPGNENRLIHLKIYSINNSLIIHVINSRREISEQNKNNSRKYPDLHGVGLLNIQKVAETYGGHLTTIAGDKNFETIIVLPFKEADK